MPEPLDSNPLVLVRSKRSSTCDLITSILGELGVRFAWVDQSDEAWDHFLTPHVKLLIAETAGAERQIAMMLTQLASDQPLQDLAVILLADAEAECSWIRWTSERFQSLLLVRPVSRECMTKAVETGLRLATRSSPTHDHSQAPSAAEVSGKTRFWAAVSHEIRTPINALVLGCQLLRAIRLDSPTNAISAAEIADLTDAMLTSANSLIGLVDDLLDIARHDSGQVELIESGLILGDWLQQSLAGHRPLAERKGLKMDVQVSTPDANLRLDQRKLARVVQILVSNAIKFTDAGHILIVSRADPNAGLRLEVEDTGIGIPPGQRQVIFDEFAQLRNPERDRSKGAGLGLAVCRRLVHAMGGTIQVDPTPRPLGTTFVVTLPASAVAPAEKSNHESA